jgi:hypothetical protein
MQNFSKGTKYVRESLSLGFFKLGNKPQNNILINISNKIIWIAQNND